ncbi:hypothetical protein [Brachybacterium sp.]|uniref:hypothetical protein n=1 Tax=Brachybacterium sp. TaxID=1891286 RepID=UPI003F8DF02C
MRKPPPASITRWTWRDGNYTETGVMVSASNGKRVLIPRDQLAIFADFAIDTLEETE